MHCVMVTGRSLPPETAIIFSFWPSLSKPSVRIVGLNVHEKPIWCEDSTVSGSDIPHVNRKIRQHICRTVPTAMRHAGHEHRLQSITDTTPGWRGAGSRVMPRILI